MLPEIPFFYFYFDAAIKLDGRLSSDGKKGKKTVGYVLPFTVNQPQEMVNKRERKVNT